MKRSESKLSENSKKSAKSSSKKDKLHLQLFSVHGLVRGSNLELGRDADTGGQVKYVVDLAKALGKNPKIKQVDLFTRYIDDKRVSSDYKQDIEPLNDKTRIVRIKCGGRRYMRKELLWGHLDEYVDNVIKFNKKNKISPDLFHGHYADAGYIARQLSKMLGIPFIFTGHSLGRNKMHSLSNDGKSMEQMNKYYNIERRIEAEEKVLANADMIITSTNHEIQNQYKLYNNHNKAYFEVIPPGIDLDIFYPYYYDEDENWEKDEQYIQARHKMHHELDRFLTDTKKPLILAICRPDSKKNIPGLVKAFGTHKDLQMIANLAIFAGIRKDIDNMDDNERDVLTELLHMMDKYDLYGSMAIPKKHDPNFEVPELYRMAAVSRGVFVNSAFNEPFGLTLIEAAASGVPIVGPDDGGPQDIVKNCQNGILVDTTDPDKIADAIKKIIVDSEQWIEYSNNGINGVRKYYAWDAHAETLLNKIQPIIEKGISRPVRTGEVAQAPGHRFGRLKKLFITDIDDTLVGDDEAMHSLIKLIKKHDDEIGFGVASGRSPELVKQILKEKKLPTPDLIIASVGTEILYGPDSNNLQPDEGWSAHIAYQWKPKRIKEILAELPFLEMQKEDGERPFKLSYMMKPSEDHIAKIHNRLSERNLRYQLIYSHNAYLDVIPQRASKGKAIDYICKKWNITPSNVLVSGDSGNDYEMIYGKRLGIVVGNHSEELESLRNNKRVYFADNEYAEGIIEGMKHYKFLDDK